jgi:chemotaxis protein histidine kinase CheA
MTDRMGLTEFFAMEAGDYLERLDALVSPPTPPDMDELTRLTRALRGSALMAKQTGIATAAEAFEHFARAAREQRRPWDESTRQLAVHAVDEFKVLIRQVGAWSNLEEERARALAAELHPEGIAKAEAGSRDTEVQIDAGTRAFIGREGAAIASALDQAAKSLQQAPRAFDPLRHVLSVAQPLRGLAILADLPPMPDLLDGVERAISEIIRSGEPIEGGPLTLNAAAQAVARAARELANEGKADPETPEVQDFAQRLQRIVEAEAGVVPIESLYFDDGGPNIVEQGTVAGRPRVLGQVELVAHGEHLRQAADEIERALSRTQLELRAQALVATFRALSAASGSALHDAVSRFALAAREAVLGGAPVAHTPAFVGQLRDAGVALAETGQNDDDALALRLQETATALEELVAAPVVPVVEEAPEPVTAVERSESVAPKEAADETPDLVGSWARYERYVDSLGLGEPSLDELLAGPPADPRHAVPAIPKPPPVVEAEEPEAVPEAAEEVVVPIADLCYSGADALDRAASLGQVIRAGLAAGKVSSDLRDLVEEVLDLVELGRTD